MYITCCFDGKTKLEQGRFFVDLAVVSYSMRVYSDMAKRMEESKGDSSGMGGDVAVGMMGPFRDGAFEMCQGSIIALHEYG